MMANNFVLSKIMIQFLLKSFLYVTFSYYCLKEYSQSNYFIALCKDEFTNQSCTITMVSES